MLELYTVKKYCWFNLNEVTWLP